MKTTQLKGTTLSHWIDGNYTNPVAGYYKATLFPDDNELLLWKDSSVNYDYDDIDWTVIDNTYNEDEQEVRIIIMFDDKGNFENVVAMTEIDYEEGEYKFEVLNAQYIAKYIVNEQRPTTSDELEICEILREHDLNQYVRNEIIDEILS